MESHFTSHGSEYHTGGGGSIVVISEEGIILYHQYTGNPELWLNACTSPLLLLWYHLGIHPEGIKWRTRWSLPGWTIIPVILPVEQIGQGKPILSSTLHWPHVLSITNVKLRPLLRGWADTSNMTNLYKLPPSPNFCVCASAMECSCQAAGLHLEGKVGENPNVVPQGRAHECLYLAKRRGCKSCSERDWWCLWDICSGWQRGAYS